MRVAESARQLPRAHESFRERKRVVESTRGLPRAYESLSLNVSRELKLSSVLNLISPGLNDN